MDTESCPTDKIVAKAERAYELGDRWDQTDNADVALRRDMAGAEGIDQRIAWLLGNHVQCRSCYIGNLRGLRFVRAESMS